MQGSCHQKTSSQGLLVAQIQGFVGPKVEVHTNLASIFKKKNTYLQIKIRVEKEYFF